MSIKKREREKYLLCQQWCEKIETVVWWWKGKMLQSQCKIVWWFLKKETELIYDPEIPILSLFKKRIENSNYNRYF